MWHVYMVNYVTRLQLLNVRILSRKRNDYGNYFFKNCYKCFRVFEWNSDLCQPVNFTMCSTRGFIHTVFPNFFDHLNEREAEEAFMITAEPVINQICQEAALNYLCSVYFPKCDAETGYFIVPCNNLCYGTTFLNNRIWITSHKNPWPINLIDGQENYVAEKFINKIWVDWPFFIDQNVSALLVVAIVRNFLILTRTYIYLGFS